MFDPTIGAVVLAAGQSRRMGAGVVKAVLPFGGVPLIRLVVQNIRAVPQIRVVCTEYTV